ncbi:hypothetical protein DXG03_000504 [Asterophora parasitica]|uniref:Ubiquitin carboxyl-terminal hydrolase n=1 Tax=Asterophora parasitica TaxID=117018 RepID=A0A9P7G508_9AGAR|nr:hypothetical protein DXG03_000504 [Asterophora parasitica]
MATTTCPHLPTLATLAPPRLSQAVHREECTQCFDSQDSPLGIDVCLSCFNGACLTSERHHAHTHARRAAHPWSLNVKRKLKPSISRPDSDEPPLKMTKLAIAADPSDDEKYDVKTLLRCWACDPLKGREIHLDDGASIDPKLKSTITALTSALLASPSSARQSEVQAWEEEILPCEHTLTLQQLSAAPISASGLAHCSRCDLKENLWLCLACGALGCGRQQFGGAGGNGHGLAHFEETGHGVSVKLGTITPEGSADVYCYICNDARIDPDIAAHLRTFGIRVEGLSKTEKSMAELQIEHNLKYDFSLTDDAGHALEPVFGAGLTGLANLGNSCYMASILQTLFSLPAFQARYASQLQPEDHAETCSEPLPASCVECQMRKVADGLLSGRYSHPANYAASPSASPAAIGARSPPTPAPAPAPPPFQAGLKPASFKALVGKGHREFATMRQQDAEEFFGWLIGVLRREAHKHHVQGEGELGTDPTAIFSYATEQRLQCTSCRRVRYRVDAYDVVSVAVPATEIKPDSASDTEGEAEKKTAYADVQLTQCVDALLGEEALEYACSGCGTGVVALRQTKFASLPEVLVVHAKKFQLVNWVPSKLDIPVLLPPSDTLEFTAAHLGRGLQPGEDELPDNDNGGSSSNAKAPALPEFNAAALAQLEGMGFPTVRCHKALLATGNSDAEAAMDWLFAHMEDPDIDDPIVLSSPGSGSAPEPPQEQIAMLADMGFTHAQARKALRETSGNAERAVEWLFNHPDDAGEDTASAAEAPAATENAAAAVIPGSKDVPARYVLKAFVSHKGPSVHSGHYVAHIRVGEEWVLFNDEKVVKADEESVAQLKKLAYLYFFERVPV